MKVKLIVAITLLFYSADLFAQPSDEAQVRQVLETQRQAWNRGDLDAFMVGYWENDSLMFIGSAGLTYGFQPTKDSYKKRYADTAQMGKLIFDIIHVQPLSTTHYYVVGKWHLTRTVGDLSGHFTLLFRKINRKWVIISDHSS